MDFGKNNCTMDRKSNIIKYFKNYNSRLDKLIKSVNFDDLTKVIDIMIECFKNEKTVFVCGHGGSASTATHMQADFSFFTRYFSDFRPKVKSLCDNNALISAISNDNNFEDIFVEQLRGNITEGDALICISASGNSKNLINAVNYANNKKMKTISFIGFDGGKLLKISSVSLFTPNQVKDYGPIEDLHLIFNHFIINYLSTDNEFLKIQPKK